MNNKRHTHSKIEHKDGRVIELNAEFKDLFSIHNLDIEENELFSFLSEEVIQDIEETLKKDGEVVTSMTKINTDSLQDSNYEKSKMPFLIVSYQKENGVFSTKFINIDYIKNLESLSSGVEKNTPIGITVAEPGSEDNPLIYVNSGFEDITGYSKEEVMGQDCRFLQGEKTRVEPVRKMSKALCDSEPVSVEIRNYKKSGDMFWNNITIVPVTDDNDKLEYFIGYQEDITERKKQEVQREVFQKQADNSSNMITILDDNLDIFYVNDTICEITGYSENQLTNSSIERLYASEFTDNMLQYIHKSESNSPTKSILETQDGKYIHVKQYISRYSGADIISDYYYIIRIEDLTEDMINNQVIDVLNRILRHNLRTDISVIQGYTNTIKSENSENEKELESILKRTNSMEDISDKMKRVRDIIKEENQTVPISVEKLQSVINNYSKDIIKVNFDSNCSKSDCYIKSGSIISMISKDIINMVRDAADKATTIRVGFDEKDKKIKISYNSEVKFVDLDDWKVVRSGEEDPLNHNIGVDLWVIQWGVTLAGGSIEIEEYDQEEQSIKITFPKVT